MINKIVDDQIRQNLNYLKITTDLISELRFYPREYINSNIKTKERIGSRNFMWAISAIDSLSRDPDLDFIPTSEQLHDIFQYAKSNYPLEEAYKTSPFWSSSQVKALGILKNLIVIYGEEKLINLSEEYLENIINKLRSEVLDKINNYDLDNDYLKWYEVNWCLDSVNDYLNPTLKLSLNQDISKFGTRRLERNLAYYTSDASAYNKIELAIAAKFAWENYSESEKILDGNLYNLLKKASSLCLNNRDDHMSKRLIYHDDKFGELHNLPWEDVFIILELPEKYFPQKLNVVKEIRDFIIKRKVGAFTEYVGLSEESFKKFPKPAPYFTNYAIVLLSKIRQVLKSRTRRQFVENINEIDPSYIVKSSEDQSLFSFENMYDTFEDTIKYIKKRLPSNQKKFQTNRSYFNSILIFGPPGTGKTTLLEGMVDHFDKSGFYSTPTIHKESRQWIGITLTPSMFLVDDTFTEVLKNVEEIFSVVLNIDHCVFLFDEAEELANDRTNERQRFGRMFTAAMLLHLNRLKQGKSIYMFATNFIHKMDDAAIRKGRFSIRKGLGWVSKDEMDNIVQNMFSSFTTIDARNYIKKNLSNRTIGEILDIRSALKRESKKELSLREVEEFLDNWKNYLSKDQIIQHKKNCEKYDDSYIS